MFSLLSFLLSLNLPLCSPVNLTLNSSENALVIRCLSQNHSNMLQFVFISPFLLIFCFLSFSSSCCLHFFSRLHTHFIFISICSLLVSQAFPITFYSFSLYLLSVMDGWDDRLVLWPLEGKGGCQANIHTHSPQIPDTAVRWTYFSTKSRNKSLKRVMTFLYLADVLPSAYITFSLHIPEIICYSISVCRIE